MIQSSGLYCFILPLAFFRDTTFPIPRVYSVSNSATAYLCYYWYAQFCLKWVIILTHVYPFLIIIQTVFGLQGSIFLAIAGYLLLWIFINAKLSERSYGKRLWVDLSRAKGLRHVIYHIPVGFWMGKLSLLPEWNWVERK